MSFMPLAFLLAAMLQPPEPYTPPTAIPNILVYDEGSVEINASINSYDTLTVNTPIDGSIFITQEKPVSISLDAFKLGEAPLKVTFVSSEPIAAGNPLTVSIYSFTLPPLSPGVHTLPSINVKIGSKTYQSLPLTVEISGSNTPAN